MDELYKTAVGVWNIDPQSFWNMTPREWWLIFDSKMAQRPSNTRKTSQADAAELYELLQEAG